MHHDWADAEANPASEVLEEFDGADGIYMSSFPWCPDFSRQTTLSFKRTTLFQFIKKFDTSVSPSFSATVCDTRFFPLSITSCLGFHTQSILQANMLFSKSLLLLAALATSSLAFPMEKIERRQNGSSWTSVPSNGVFSTSGFGGRTGASGAGDTYTGNVGNPYGSNIIEVSPAAASSYKYVVQFASAANDWTVAIWNKYGPDGKMDGWFGNACKTFTLPAGTTKYIAFDEDSQGGWAAAQGSIPTNSYGGYSSTWGEFDFGSTANNAWSGFDVSAIQAQLAGLPVQGMQICSVYNSNVYSSITPNAGSVNNAYTSAQTAVGGIGGNLPAGPVRLATTIGYLG